MKNLVLVLLIPVFAFATCREQKKPAPVQTAFLDMPDFTALQMPDSLRAAVALLGKILKEDQIYRMQYNSLSAKEQKLRYHEFSSIIRKADSLNLLAVDSIIRVHGWLGYNQVGFKASNGLFLVIQHADQAKQEQYLPIIHKAKAEGKILPSSYAMFVDRVELRRGKAQKFGTQVAIGRKRKAELMPLLNADSVEVWRKVIGIRESFPSYLKRFGIKWNIEEYKKREGKLKRKYRIL